MSWQKHLTSFKNYMKLERSLSENSIESYFYDLAKLEQYLSLTNIDVENATISPLNVTEKQITAFLQYLGGLGIAETHRHVFCLVSRHFINFFFGKISS